jgi:UDPglucose 6-dehydrogenase
MRKITVCGLGKLGVPMAALFAARKFDVMGYDIDLTRIASVQAHINCVHEPHLQELLHKIDAGECGRLRATADAREAVEGTDACVLVCPTPSVPDGSFDNTFLEMALNRIVYALNEQPHSEQPYLFVIASTVNPGSCQNVFEPYLKKYLLRPHYLVYKPELIALGTVLHDLQFPDVALFGGDSSQAKEAGFALYKPILFESVPCKFLSTVEVELAKIALNCAITTKISFANQVAIVARHYCADPHKILDAIGTDTRIGSKCLKPGMPFGGPCFPRDNRMFQHAAKRVNCHAYLAEATDTINELTLREILLEIPERRCSVGILGLGYKAGTQHTDESPGVHLRNRLFSKNLYTIKCYDPMLAAHNPHTPLEEVLACDVVIVTIAAPEFHDLEFDTRTILLDPLQVTKTARERAQ